MTTTRIADTRLAPSETIEESYTDITPCARPKENKSITQLKTIETLSRTTFHQIRKVVEDDLLETTYFLKENPRGSPVSELEATSAAFYKLLAYPYVPATYAVTDEKNDYIGVISEEISEFKSTVTDPLNEEDLQIDFIKNKKLSFAILDELDANLTNIEEKAHIIKKKSRKLEENEERLNEALDQLTIDPSVEHKITLLNAEFEANSLEKIKIYKEKTLITKETIHFYLNAQKTYSITKKELENYRIIKGLATTLTTSYIFMEDDLHQNNLSKDGKRIDFDMSLWPILYDFKEDKFCYFRAPNENTFKVTSEDILEFPDLKHASPFYWPTKPSSAFPDAIIEKIRNVIPLSANAYPHKVNALYHKLAKNPVFIYHKFSTLAKYILTDEKMYKSLANHHMRKGHMHHSKLLLDIIVKQQSERIAEFSNVLLNIPDFGTFFKLHHQRLIDELVLDAHKVRITVDKSKIEMTRTRLLSHIENITSPPEPSAPESKEVKTTVSPTETLDELKAAVIASMENYKNPGIFAGGGLFRHHADLAKELIVYCNELKSYPSGNMEAILHLRDTVSAALSKISSGLMHEYLFNLVERINKAVPDSSIKNHKSSTV